jgi:molybdopterin converting factor small subunit
MTKEQLNSLVNLHGSRVMSNRLINSKINQIVGLDMNDLPDTSELCDVIDELDELLQSKDYTIEDIRNVLNNINIEFIQEMVFG